MNRTRVKQTIVALSAAALVAIGGSAALAASGSSATGTSFLDRVAQHLGITTQKLQDAAKAAAIDEVAARLEAGAITQTQADAMKQAIESGKGFGLGDFGMGRHGHLGGGMRGGPGGPGGHLADAASYLGLTESALFTQLRSGMTLAGVAKAQGKTVEGLKAALVASEEKEIAAAVEAGALTRAQADALLTESSARLDAMIAGTMPPGGPMGGHDRFGHGDHDGDGGMGDGMRAPGSGTF